MPPASPLVIFDLGDTVITGPARGPARRIGEAFDLDRARRRKLHGALMTIDFAGPAAVAEWMRRHLGLADAEPVVERVWRAQEEEAEPVPGALGVLQRLHDDGFRLALLSNIWAPYLTAARRHFGAFFAEHIPPALQVFSYQSGFAKPDPRGFQALLRAGGVSADRCVMIGDAHELDIEPAARLGLRTVWILRKPDQEVEELVRVINREAAAPTRAVRCVTDVDGVLVRRVLEASQ